MTAAESIPLVVTIVLGFATLSWPIYAKRQDDRRAAQLERLAEQLSKLYGPLYALYQAGERNWCHFRDQYSRDPRPPSRRVFLPGPGDTFPPPGPEAIAEYRRRMEQLFMPLNERMASVIVEHAGLLVGDRMPEEFSAFLAHVDAARLMVHRWQSDAGFGTDDWEGHHVDAAHPARLQHAIRASFRVLKEAQLKLLAGELPGIDERELQLKIADRIDELEREARTAGAGAGQERLPTLGAPAGIHFTEIQPAGTPLAAHAQRTP